LTQGIWYPSYCPSPQDLAQGAASQQKLIDAAAAVSSRTEHAEVTERQLKSLPAKLAQIQGSSAAAANADVAADADVAEDAVEADMAEEAEESDDEDELGSISSGEDSEVDDDEEVADAEEGTGADVGALAAGVEVAAPMERESASAREGEAQLASAGESLLDATPCPSWVLSPLIMCCCCESLSTALDS